MRKFFMVRRSDSVQRVKINEVGRKCLYCGKRYQAGTDLRECSCKDKGRLFAAGICLQNKLGGEKAEGKI